MDSVRDPDEIPGAQLVHDIAGELGVPAGTLAAMAVLRIQPPHAVGWEVFLGGEGGPVELDGAEGWPAGVLSLAGAAVAEVAPGNKRPLVVLERGILEVYWSELLLPSRRARATCAWEPRTSAIGLLPGHWNAADAKDAEAALRWLETLPRTGGPTAMSDEDALEEAVRFGLEWLADHPGKEPADFGRREFQQKRCSGSAAVKKWMRNKHFGIRTIQREMARRVRL